MSKVNINYVLIGMCIILIVGLMCIQLGIKQSYKNGYDDGVQAQKFMSSNPIDCLNWEDFTYTTNNTTFTCDGFVTTCYENGIPRFVLDKYGPEGNKNE